jgi:hypothetical protein
MLGSNIMLGFYVSLGGRGGGTCACLVSRQLESHHPQVPEADVARVATRNELMRIARKELDLHRHGAIGLLQ